MACSRRSGVTATWAMKLSQSAPASMLAPRRSHCSVSEAPSSRAVPSVSADAVSSDAPSCPAASRVAPASTIASTVTIGKRCIGATETRRPFASVA